MKNLTLSFLKDETAATAIEYGLIAAGISVAIIAVVQGLGTKLNLSLIHIYISLRCLRAGRPGGFGFLHRQGQGQSYCHFQTWEGSHRRNPGTGRILR